jgi:hypothetical protein
MIYLTFLAAFLLSGIAAYYSVVGLAAIFMGAFWPVVIMGSALEFSKLVTASWLYRNWKTTPILLRSYLTIAVVILMLITSMGIFGFLAKSHIDSTLDSGANSIELKAFNQQQKITEDKLNYLLARAKDPSTASNRLDKQIQDAQKELTNINKQKLPLLKESNKLSADVGPIKYVADMFFGDGEGSLDKAVRMVIFAIMLVFDPLAVLLLIAGNISLKAKDEVKTDSTEIPVEDWVSPIQSDEERPSNKVEIEKENITSIEERFSQEEPRIKVKKIIQHSPGVYSETYDYEDEYAFREKENK